MPERRMNDVSIIPIYRSIHFRPHRAATKLVRELVRAYAALAH